MNRLRGSLVLAVVFVGAVLLSYLYPGISDGASSASCPPTPAGGPLRLVAAPQSVEAGQTTQFRVVNSTDSGVTYGLPYTIQQCADGVWFTASFSPTGPWHRPLVILPPASKGRWVGIETPADAVAGAYRVEKTVRVEEKARRLYAPFRIEGSSPAD